MTDPELIARLASVPLYADLDDEERADVALGLRLLNFQAGQALIRQGAEPDGIYFIVNGEVRVTTKLPGGGEALIAELGPGSTHGELALLRSVPRSATVTAAGPVEAIYADWRFLSAALAQLRPGAFKVFRRLALVLAGRLRALHGRIHEAAMRGGSPYEMSQLPSAPEEAGEGGARNGFDVGAFLPVLPCFRGFDPASIAAVQARARVIRPTRGYKLLSRDQAPEHAYVVVRGAVASGHANAGRIHLMNVRGPGCFCNASPVIENRPVSADYVVFENAVLLELPRTGFLELYLGFDQTAFVFLTAITEHQAAMVSRTTNHLKRLVGLSRVFQQLRAGPGRTVSPVVT
jgi:CRP/FNR family transcriptional regulator, cyclic AMP receptor protein